MSAIETSTTSLKTGRRSFGDLGLIIGIIALVLISVILPVSNGFASKTNQIGEETGSHGQAAAFIFVLKMGQAQ
jgi:hypothetical protein